jgi:tetratricopeptide (TPR) repeat protein
MAPRPVHPLQLAAEISLGLCVASGALALGGAPRWAMWPVAVFGWAAAMLWVAGAWRLGRRARWHPILYLPLGSLGLCLVQLLPVPPLVLGWLSPEAADLVGFTVYPLGLDRWRPISIEPAATWLEVAKHATYTAVLFVALQVGRSSRPRMRLLGMLAAVGTTVALIGFVHRLLGLNTLFGLYQFANPQHLLTTFGNPNHLAAFLTVTGIAATGLAVSTDNRQKAAVFSLSAVVIAVAVLLSLSRGGIAVFFFAQAVLGLVVVGRRGGGWGAAAPVGVGVGAIGLALYLVSDQLMHRLHTVDTLQKVQQSKIELWPMFADAAAFYTRLGMGRGAFEVAFTRYLNRQVDVTFTHPENLGLQLAAEFGLPATLALLGLALFCLVNLLRSKKGGLLEYAAMIGVGAVVLHDVFDFALELPASALAATVAIGAAFSVTAESAPKVRSAFAAAGLAGLLGCLAMASFGARHSVQEDEQALRELIAQRPDIERLRDEAKVLIDRHPGDFLLYSMMAQDSARRGEAWESLAWVNRVLFLRPADSNAHTAAAVALLRLGKRSQALGEFRLAFEGGDRAGMDLAVKYSKSVDELDRLTSGRPELVVMVSASLRRSQRVADADALLQRHLVSGAPAELILYAADIESARGDHARALVLLKDAALQVPDSVPLISKMAAELAWAGKYEDSVTLLQTALARRPDSLELGLALIQRHLEGGKPVKAREVITRMLPFAQSAWARARLLQREAMAHQAEAHPALAVRSMQIVVQLEPAEAGHHFQLASLQEQLGRVRDARNSMSRGIAAAGPSAGAAEKAALRRLDQVLEARVGPQGMRDGDLERVLTPDTGKAP